MLATVTPSMTMLPSAASSRRNNDSDNDDLPAPVRPTIPTCNARTSMTMRTTIKDTIVTGLAFGCKRTDRA